MHTMIECDKVVGFENCFDCKHANFDCPFIRTVIGKEDK